MPSRSISDLHPDLAYAYGVACGRWMHLYPNAPKPFLTATHRPDAEQDQLYAQGRTMPGPVVTDAKAGQSPHNFKPALALDVAFKYP
ncbi:M15 family metallopeptidase, partial [Arsenicibacter rosenii]|uniref:M15 family metallopeptidase n=1 Tax=Arsenicibacter rosenii TaxID=1750698 RepID=UPI000B0366CB